MVMETARKFVSDGLYVTGSIGDFVTDIKTLPFVEFNQKYNRDFGSEASLLGTLRRTYNQLGKSRSKTTRLQDIQYSLEIQLAYQERKDNPPSPYGDWNVVTRNYPPCIIVFEDKNKVEKVIEKNNSRTSMAFVGEFIEVNDTVENFYAKVTGTINPSAGKPIKFMEWAELVAWVFNSAFYDHFFSGKTFEIAFDVMLENGNYYRVPFCPDESKLLELLIKLLDNKEFYSDEHQKIVYVKPIIALVDSGQFLWQTGTRTGIYIAYR